jgi:hypothetical protein
VGPLIPAPKPYKYKNAFNKHFKNWDFYIKGISIKD